MKIIQQLNCIEGRTAVAIGKFDGLHIGHRLILDGLQEAKRQDPTLQTTVFTFSPSPAVFFGGKDVKELFTQSEKRTTMEELGIDCLVEYPFDREGAACEPETFIRHILCELLHAKVVVCGKDVSFGKGGRGDLYLLEKLAGECGYQVLAVDKVQVSMEGRSIEVSSSLARELITAGKMELANSILCKPYSFCGTVERGTGIGHKDLLPTVNLVPEAGKLLPPRGVYVSRVCVEGVVYGGITNIGCKPTVSTENRIGIETFLYDFDGNLYDKPIEVSLLKWTRPEKTFSGLAELMEQLRQDEADGRAWFMEHPL